MRHLLLLILCIATVSCEKEAKQDLSSEYIIDDTGTKFSLSATPQRIISLAPDITHSIYLLTAQDRLIANTIFCETPPDAKNKQKIGTLLEPDIEKIILMKPDLVLATKEGNRPETVNKLRELNIPVFVIGEANSFSQICQSFITLGKILKKEDVAKKIIQEAQKEVDTIKKQIGSQQRKRVFIQVGTNPLVTTSRNTFLHEIISCAGGSNIAEDISPRWPPIDKELVIKEDPDVIIILDMQPGAKDIWSNFKDLKAVINNRVYLVEQKEICQPNPVNFARSVKLVARLLHPEIFQQGK